MIGNDDEV